MDKEKLKFIVRNLESLVDCLKSEIYSDVDVNSYKQEFQYEEIAPYIDDYDEVFYDEEDDNEKYESVKINKKNTNNDGDGL
jgi:hypothetical protein